MKQFAFSPGSILGNAEQWLVGGGLAVEVSFLWRACSGVRLLSVFASNFERLWRARLRMCYFAIV